MRQRKIPSLATKAAAVALLAAALSTPAQADTGRGRHKQLYIPPAPGPVTVDGRLDDWDLSGQIEMFVIEATRGTMSAKIAAMHDEEALYLSGEVRDPTPMMNRHDPKVTANRAWDADACQFRLVLDPEAGYPVQESSFNYRGANASKDARDDIVHLLLWHYTDEGTANLQMHLGMSYRVPRPEWGPHGLVPYDKFEGAYRKWEDGGGYTFEYRIPWETLGAERPLRGGDVVAGTTQVNWSRPDGLKTGGGSAWSYDILGAPGFPFQSAACWGRLIFTEQGDIPIELVREGLPPERQLPLELEYELPADSVHTTVQLFNQDNQAVRILVAQQERPGGVNRERWDGLDDRGHPLPPGEYRWRGVRSEQPLKLQYRFSVHNSGQPPYPTGDNTGGWGADHGTPQTVAAFDGGMLLAWNSAEYGWGMIRTDIDGKKQWGSKSGARHVATDGTLIFYAGDQGFHTDEAVRIMALVDSRPTRLANGVEIFAAPSGGDASGRPASAIPGEEETGKDTNNEVTGLAYADGRLYVAYGHRDLIGVFSTETGELLGTLEVPKPGRLAMTPAGAVLAISEGKVREWRVASGQWRVVVDSHLDAPQSVAVAADGTIHVANRGALQNVSVFDADGNYLRSLGRLGGRPAMGAYDPSGMYQADGIALDARGRLWVAENADFPKRISVWDAATGTTVAEFFGGSCYFGYGNIDPARPHEIYAHNVLWEIDWKTYTAKPATTIWRRIEPDMAPPPTPSGYGGNFRMFTADNGRQFGWGGTDQNHNTVLYMRDGELMRPIAGFINPWNISFPGLEELKREMTAAWDAARVAGHHRSMVLFWQDANDDGLVQPDEVVAQPHTRIALNWVQADLTLRFNNGLVLRPASFTGDGKPVYDFAMAEKGGVGGMRDYVAMTPDGATLVLGHSDQRANRPCLVKWSADGEMLWNYPDLLRWQVSLGMPIGAPGRLWAMTGNMGVAGDYFAHMTYVGPNHIFRLDGTYIGAVIKDGRVMGDRGAYEGQPEGQGGTFVKLDINGEGRTFIIHGGQDSRVWEVHGLEAMESLEGGVYVHTEEAHAIATRALADYEAAKAGKARVAIGRGREALDTVAPVGKKLEGGRAFEIRLAYDDAKLYLRYDVTAPHGLDNATPEDRIVFRGGNLIDIQLATDPAANPARKTPAPGDLRLLVTRRDGQPFAMLYRPKVAGFDGEPVVLRSPTGTESFDRIETVEVGLDYARTENGFRATLTVPLATLGWQPRTGTEIRLDLGYVFGNAEGTRAAARAYLFNNTFTANVVDDIPHESRLEPAEWGEAAVE